MLRGLKATPQAARSWAWWVDSSGLCDLRDFEKEGGSPDARRVSGAPG